MSRDEQFRESGRHLVEWSEATSALAEILKTASGLADNLEMAAKRLRDAVKWAEREDRSDTISDAFPYPNAEQVNGVIADIKRYSKKASESRDQLKMKHPHLEL